MSAKDAGLPFPCSRTPSWLLRVPEVDAAMPALVRSQGFFPLAMGMTTSWSDHCLVSRAVDYCVAKFSIVAALREEPWCASAAEGWHQNLVHLSQIWLERELDAYRPEIPLGLKRPLDREGWRELTIAVYLQYGRLLITWYSTKDGYRGVMLEAGVRRQAEYLAGHYEVRRSAEGRRGDTGTDLERWLEAIAELAIVGPDKPFPISGVFSKRTA